MQWILKEIQQENLLPYQEEGFRNALNNGKFIAIKVLKANRTI